MKCSKCQSTEMRRETFRGIELDVCPDCRGIFFDQGELEDVLQAKLAEDIENLTGSDPIDAQRDHAQAQCSRCNQPMRSCRVPGSVRFDWCKQCGGIYLDRGELTELQQNDDS